MNKIILCEGATDAILLSYYLGKVSGWSFCRKPPKDIAIREDYFEESINWYEKEGDRLLICGVGGRDKMRSFFQKKILKPITDANAFARIALVLDRDNKDISSVEAHASSVFRPVINAISNNRWRDNYFTDAFGVEQKIESLLVVVPTEHQGALETIMLDAISDDPYDAVIVEKSGAFVKDIRNDASRYIVNDRAELKAHLGVTWAVQYPEKVFKLIDEQIRSVEWEKSEVLRKCFEQLILI